MPTIDDAIHTLRNDPKYETLVRDSYFDSDVIASGKRFLNSGEFQEVKKFIGSRLNNGIVIDVGAGTGIASYAFAQSGAKHVYAVEPEPSNEVGRGAIERIRGQLPITVLNTFGDNIPLDSNLADVVYVRQVLHHIQNLPASLKEFARLLKPGGIFIACREHVVKDEQQLAEFLKNHPIHQLVGGENAYPLQAYLAAIKQSGLELQQCLGPWDSVINAFPNVASQQQLATYADDKMRERYGNVASKLLLIPGVRSVVWQWIKRPVAGQMYSFVALKPDAAGSKK